MNIWTITDPMIEGGSGDNVWLFQASLAVFHYDTEYDNSSDIGGSDGWQSCGVSLVSIRMGDVEKSREECENFFGDTALHNLENYAEDQFDHALKSGELDCAA